MLFSRRRSSISNTPSLSVPPTPSRTSTSASSPTSPTTSAPSSISTRPTTRRKSISSVLIPPRRSSPPPTPSPTSDERTKEINALQTVFDEMDEVVKKSGVDCSVGRCVGVLRGIFEMFKHNHETQQQIYLFRLLRDRIDVFKGTIFDRVFTAAYDVDDEFAFGDISSERETKKEIAERFGVGRWRYDKLESDLELYLQTLKKHPKNYGEFTKVLNLMNMSGVSIAVTNERDRLKGKGRATSEST